MSTASSTEKRIWNWMAQHILALLVVVGLVIAVLPGSVDAKKDNDGTNAEVAAAEVEAAPDQPDQSDPVVAEDGAAPDRGQPRAEEPRQSDPAVDESTPQGDDEGATRNDDAGPNPQREQDEGETGDGEADSQAGHDASHDTTLLPEDNASRDGGAGDDGRQQDDANAAAPETAVDAGDATANERRDEGTPDEIAAPSGDRASREQAPEPEAPVPLEPVVSVSANASCTEQGAVEGVVVVRVDDAPATITDIVVAASPNSSPIVPALQGTMPATVEPGRADWNWSLPPLAEPGTGWSPTGVLVRVAEYASNGSGDEGWLTAGLNAFATPCAPPLLEATEPAVESDIASEHDATAAPSATEPAAPVEDPDQEMATAEPDAGQSFSLAPGDAVVVISESELRDAASWSVLLVVPAGTGGQINSGPYQAEDGSWWYEVTVPQATGFLGAETLAHDQGGDGGTDNPLDGEATATPRPPVSPEPTEEPIVTPDPTADATVTPEPVAEEPTETPEPVDEPGPVTEPTEEPTATPEPTASPIATAPPESIETPTVEPSESSQGVDAITVEAMSADEAVLPGALRHYRFRLTNTANAPMMVRPVVSNTRDGWTAIVIGTGGSSGDGPLTLSAGETVDLVVEVAVPEFASAGEENVTTLVLEAAKEATT